MDLLKEIKSKECFIQTLRNESNERAKIIYREYQRQVSELNKELQSKIDVVNKDIDYLRKQYSVQPSPYSDLDQVIDKILTTHQLYRGRESCVYGYTLSIFSSINKHNKLDNFSHSEKCPLVSSHICGCLTKLRLHLKTKYASETCNDDLLVFIGYVKCSEEDIKVLEKYKIFYKTKFVRSSAN